MIIAGVVAVAYVRGRLHHGQLSLDDDKCISGMTELEEFHMAGDCLEPKGILEAIADGSRVGRSI